MVNLDDLDDKAYSKDMEVQEDKADSVDMEVQEDKMDLEDLMEMVVKAEEALKINKTPI